jgi:Cu/Ag efflux protein CusF
VKAVDEQAGTITIDHGPIPEADWPAMTMAFEARPAELAKVQPGEKVRFELKLKDGAGTITHIEAE